MLPESHSRVLEDTDEALIQNGEEAEVVEGEEFASLDELQPEVPAAPTKKPEEKKPAAAAAATPPAAGDDDIPAEFRGKSLKDVVKMYQEAHSTIGRQGQELGEYRRKADQVIQASLRVLEAQKAGQQPAAADVKAAAQLPDESEVFAKPIETINKLVENHPLLQEIKKTLGAAAAERAATRAHQATERFNQAHPDAGDIIKDPEFRQWVAASPIRRDLLLRANNKFDFAAGDEVFSTWKALKTKPAAPAAEAGTTTPAPAAEGQPTPEEVSAAAATLARARKGAQATQAAAAKAAAVPTGGASAAPAKGGQKMYRRADIIQLMVDQPERYEQLSGEIQRAYAEGRVK